MSYKHYARLLEKHGRDAAFKTDRLESLDVAFAKLELAIDSYLKSSRNLAYKGNILRKFFDETGDDKFLIQAIDALDEALLIKEGPEFDELVPPSLHHNRACYVALLGGENEEIKSSLLKSIDSEPTPRLRDVRRHMILTDTDLTLYVSDPEITDALSKES